MEGFRYKWMCKHLAFEDLLAFCFPLLLAVIMNKNILMAAGDYRNEMRIAIISDVFCSGRVFARPLLWLHQFIQKEVYDTHVTCSVQFPLWDTGDVIANFIPFVASGESATALTQQPQQNSPPDQWPQRPSVSVLNVQATLTWKRPVRHFQIRASSAYVGGRTTWNYSQRKLSRGCDKIYEELNVIYNHLPTNSQC